VVVVVLVGVVQVKEVLPNVVEYVVVQAPVVVFVVVVVLDKVVNEELEVVTVKEVD
jgi:hypothetical protein